MSALQRILGELVERLKAKDGMAVNAKIWQQAHDYHLRHQQAHYLFSHGSGIVSGLNVKAREDMGIRRVLIEAGIAVDPQGRILILERGTRYAIPPDKEGLVYLFIMGQGEKVLSQTSKKDPLLVHNAFIINSSSTLPDNAVELARIDIWGKNKKITDAKNQMQPQTNELDLRFRKNVGAAPERVARIAISYLGNAGSKSLPLYKDKAGHLARALSHLLGYQVWADDNIPLVADQLLAYALVYLHEYAQTRSTDLRAAEMAALRTYLNKGGILFIDSEQGESSPLLQRLSKDFNIHFQDLPVEHALLSFPFPFAASPDGHTPKGSLKLGNSVIFSARGFGYLWQRQPDNGAPPAREKIRAALEWGANMVDYAVEQRSRQKI